MKYLLILLAVLAGVWLWRKQRVQQEQPPQLRAPPQFQDMVRCAHCGVHLPRGDAVLEGAHMYYCSTAHRDRGPA